MDRATRGRLKGSFDRVAETYARSRPGYPEAAVAWITGNRRLGAALDLGAGGGALTQLLISRVGCVVAAEPSGNLLDELRIRSPGARAVCATAEQLPFARGVFDLVTVATAFHWFDHERCLPEIARVLAPGGFLGLMWNTRELDSAWTDDLDRLMTSAQPATLQGHWGTDSVHALAGQARFDEPDYAEFRHVQPVDREGLIDLVATRSYVIALEPGIRGALLAQVGALFDAHAGGAGVLEMPYRCQCWRARVQGA